MGHGDRQEPLHWRTKSVRMSKNQDVSQIHSMEGHSMLTEIPLPNIGRRVPMVLQMESNGTPRHYVVGLEPRLSHLVQGPSQ